MAADLSSAHPAEGEAIALSPPTLGDRLRALVFTTGIVLLTAGLGVLCLPLLLAPERLAWKPVRWWSHGVLFLLRHVVGVRQEVRGLENLPENGGIIAAKHQSAWETVIFLVLLQRPAYILKRELLAIPIYGWFIRKIRMIPIDRKGGAGALRRMVSAAQAAARAGRVVVIFPEGTRVPPGQRRRFLPGIAALYDSLEKPVVPVALCSGLCWGRGLFGKRSGRIVMEILPPLPANLPRAALLQRLQSDIHDTTVRLEADVLAPRADAGRGGLGDPKPGPPGAGCDAQDPRA
jgi:1-acyl-sn-glycerol-3-phosphate acyltransferase